MGQVCSVYQLTPQSTVQFLYASYYICHFIFVLGNIIMPRTYKRKTERANTALDIVLRAVRAVRIENRSIRSVARDFGIPFRSLTRYCSRAFVCKKVLQLYYFLLIKHQRNPIILFLNIICLKFKICFSYLFIAIILFSLLKLHFMFVSTFAIPSDWIFSFEL